MTKYPCPSCGAEITFQSSISVYCVCPYCGSMVVLHNGLVDSLGKMAELPDDFSPLQIGTEGVFNGVHFGIIGRMKMSYGDGTWNEWCLMSDDGRKGWLAEAQGFYAVSYEVMPNADGTWFDGVHDDALPWLKAPPKLDQTIKIGDKYFTVTDIKEAECIAVEGELPLIAKPGRKAIYLDMLNETGDFAGLEYYDAVGRLYMGRYASFRELQLAHLRELEGWKTPNAALDHDRKAPDGW